MTRIREEEDWDTAISQYLTDVKRQWWISRHTGRTRVQVDPPPWPEKTTTHSPENMVVKCRTWTACGWPHLRFTAELASLHLCRFGFDAVWKQFNRYLVWQQRLKQKTKKQIIRWKSWH